MVTSTIPTILTPRVAAAHANGNKEEVQKAIPNPNPNPNPSPSTSPSPHPRPYPNQVQKAIGESIVISAMIGIVVTAALWFLQE
jgi:hypothetical protein